MNAVEKVKNLCKERHIAISKLEKDLDFANGYISQLRKGTFPADRLSRIANYFDLPISYFLETQKETPAAQGDGLEEQRAIWSLAWDRATPDARAAALAVLMLQAQPPADPGKAP